MSREPVEIKKIVYGGLGLGHFEGRTIFLPYTAPGDVVTFEITADKKKVLFGEPETIIEPSPLRIKPDCPVFGICGGCQMLHLSYENEIEVKKNTTLESLERIGGRETIEVDVRILAATQKNLKEAFTTGDFREDLYYRLSVVTIDVSPLRSRGSDILLLADYFRRKSCEQMKRPMAKFDPSATQALEEHEWPGNVRELENRVKRAVVMGDGPFIRAEDLDLPFADQGDAEKRKLKDVRERLERDFICETLASNNWNIAHTAQEIGVTRPTLYDLMKKYDLRKQAYTCTS